MTIRFFIVCVLIVAAATPCGAQTADAGASRLKDVTSVQGASDTPLIGYGLMTYVATNQTHQHEPVPPSGA